MDAERAALERLAERLWDQRRIVTLLLYRLTVNRLLRDADEPRFAPEALREVDQAVELLHAGELERGLAVRDLAVVWQTAPDQLLLPELVTRAPEPYATSFRDNLDAFRQLADEIDRVESARFRAEDVPAELVELQVQEIGYQATSQAVSRVLPPSLVSFLR